MRLIAVLIGACFALPAWGQSSGGFVTIPTPGGRNVTAADVNAAFAKKLDFLNPQIVGGSISPSTAVSVMGTGSTVARTLQQRATDIIQAADFGVRCDGITNDSPALQAALNYAATLGGRTVMLPANKAACRLQQGVKVSDAAHSGVKLQGTGGMYWPGPYNNVEASWTAFGTWIHCEDTVNACVTVAGNGSAVDGISFWYTQPTPPAGADCGTPCTMTHNWTPTQYPYTISVDGAQNFYSLSNINIINASHCLNLEGTQTGVSNLYSHVNHMYLGCFNVGTKFSRVDNALDFTDVNYTIWWYQFSSDLVGYTEGDVANPGHKVDWDMYYLANIKAVNIEFVQSYIAIRANDLTVNSGLGAVNFGAQALQMANVSFNGVCRAVAMGSNTTHFSARMVNVIANADTQTSSPTQCAGANPYFFDLRSDNVDVAISNLDGYLVQSLAGVGGGISGTLHINGARLQNYSAYAPGAPGFEMFAGAALDMPSDLNAIRTSNAGAGPRIRGGTNWPTVSTGNDIEGAVNTVRQLRFLHAPANTVSGGGLSIGRWGLRVDSTPETGGNVGSGLGFDRYADSGAYIDSPFTINRATGVPYLVNGFQVALPTSCTGRPTGTVWNNVGVLNVCP